MHRTLTRHLLDLSIRFEDQVPESKENPIQALSILNELVGLTQANLPPAPAAAIPKNYSSANQEYHPALKNSEVVQALLDLQANRNHQRDLLRTTPSAHGHSGSFLGHPPGNLSNPNIPVQSNQSYNFKRSMGSSSILSPKPRRPLK